MATSFSNHRLSRQFLLPALVLIVAVLPSCSSRRYTYTFNDNVVFSPGPSSGGTRAVLRDPALQACLNQIMEALSQTDPAAVKLLACPGNGVETLAGIEALEQLEQLELSDNRITDIGPLGQLKNLRVLGMRNNRITSIGALEDLALLRFVSLQDNNGIPCSQISELKSRLGNTLSSPAQCTE